MERYTARQVKRALAQEQLLKRLDQGEDFDVLCKELGLSHNQDYMSELRRRYREGGSTWEALIDHRHGHASKGMAERRVWLREQKIANPALTQHELVDLYRAEFEETISQSRVSDILREEGVATPGGQRYHPQEEANLAVERAGVFFPSECGDPDESAGNGDPGRAEAKSELPGT